MTTVEGKLAVMGGAAKINGMTLLISRWSNNFDKNDPGGDTEYLDDVEIFDGRRWKRANYKLDQVRSNFDPKFIMDMDSWINRLLSHVLVHMKHDQLTMMLRSN